MPLTSGAKRERRPMARKSENDLWLESRRATCGWKVGGRLMARKAEGDLWIENPRVTLHTK
eukprot:2957316-Lingulodinium_polyedra.AAC.1